MAYVTVNNQLIVLFEQRAKELEQEAAKAIQAAGQSLTPLLDPKTREKLMQEILARKQREDPKGFYSQWVTFDLADDDATRHVWPLLNDYCVFYGHAFLSDHRDLKAVVVPDQRGDAPTHPPAKTFALNHFIAAKRWDKLTKNTRDRVIRIFIDTRTITRLVGNLRKFEIHTRSLRLVCGESVEVHPYTPPE